MFGLCLTDLLGLMSVPFNSCLVCVWPTCWVWCLSLLIHVWFVFDFNGFVRITSGLECQLRCGCNGSWKYDPHLPSNNFAPTSAIFAGVLTCWYHDIVFVRLFIKLYVWYPRKLPLLTISRPWRYAGLGKCRFIFFCFRMQHEYFRVFFVLPCSPFMFENTENIPLIEGQWCTQCVLPRWFRH